MHHPRSHRAFTLVELLVVVAIIVILIAILIPSLEVALHEANKAKCLSNFKGIGTAVNMYVNEKKRYPNSPGYGRMFGKKGTANSAADFSAWDSDTRPLNEYLGFTGPGAKVDIAECPSDLGDPLYAGISNCYESYGNSYHEAGIYNYSAWGFAPAFNGQPSVNIKPLHNKILLGDYGLYGDRPIVNSNTRWHQRDYNPSEPARDQVRQLNVLFGDGRAEFYTFDNALVDSAPDVDPNNATRPPNPSGKYW